MAEVRIADIIEPTTFERYTAEAIPVTSRFWRSGAIQSSPLITAKLRGGGSIFHLPMWKPLDPEEPNISSDDPGVTATPKKITGTEMRGIARYVNQTWKRMDLAAALAGDDPLRLVAEQNGAYWANVLDKEASQILRGLVAGNVANDGSDMTRDIAEDAPGAPSADKLFGSTVFNEALETMGDRSAELGAVAMHSVVYHRLRLEGQIEYRSDEEEKKRVAIYQGHSVIVDDDMPAVAMPGGNNRFQYTSVIFGGAMFGYGDAPPEDNVETFRMPLEGNGGGSDAVINRRVYTLHPLGYDFAGATAAVSPSWAELSAASAFARKFERKNVPLAFIQTNG